MRRIIQRINRAAPQIMLSTAFALTIPNGATAHSDRGEKLPKTYDEAIIGWTENEVKREPMLRHPPGNVRAEDMRKLFGNRVLVVDAGRKFSTVGASDHALKVVFIGRDERYVWCSYGSEFTYRNSKGQYWAPVKVKHAGMLSHRFDPNINNDNIEGLSPLYDGNTGQIVWYARRGPRNTWHTWDPGHLQERLPRAVWTLCPDFPSAEELGVGVNEAQTAITYDRLIEQDPGRRVLRPDLITPDPTEVIE